VAIVTSRPDASSTRELCTSGSVAYLRHRTNSTFYYNLVVRSADLIREARLRAGLSQKELAARSGRERSVIARWEQGVVAPSLETLVELVRACGFDVPLELTPYDGSTDEGLKKNARLSPERRVQRMLQARSRVAGPPR
jgi:transcriptional regulator with XRE-family HTH domain